MQSIDLFDMRMDLDPHAGRLALACDGRQVRGIVSTLRLTVAGEAREVSLLADASMAVEDAGLSAQGRFSERTVVLSASQPPVRTTLRLTARRGDPCLELSATIELTEARDDVRVEELELLGFGLGDTWLSGPGLEPVRSWINTYNVWGQPGSRPVAGAVDPDDCTRDRSHWFGGLYADGEALAFGHRLPCRWINALVQKEEDFALVERMAVPLRRGVGLHSDLAWLSLAEPIRPALRRLAARQPGRRRAIESADHWGWNSWDTFRQAVTEADVLEAVAFIRATPWLRGRMRYIIVDDGWQTGCGQWEPDLAKFPDGMAGLAEKIREAGFVPGMWAAPFFVDRHSPLLRAHPDWAVRYKGELFSPYKLIGCEPPWGDRGYLDPTHPAVQEHVYRLYRRFREWGFGYFKTDFLSDPFNALIEQDPKLAVAEPHKHLRLHDPDAGLLAGHRACMEAIRAAIGEESFWLGCGTLTATGAGLMDASRIGSDIAPYYSTLLSCIRSVAWNFHWHGGLWLNDPDFAVFRGPATSDPALLDVQTRRPYSRHDKNSGSPFSPAEARMWASMLILSGGLVVLSDRLTALNEAGLAIVRTLVEHGGGPSAEPLDIDGALPAVYLKQHGRRRYLGLFNWNDERPRLFRLDGALAPGLPADAVGDLWTGQAVSVGDELELAPHTCRLLMWERRVGGMVIPALVAV